MEATGKFKPMQKTTSYNSDRSHGSNSPPARPSLFMRKNDQSSQSSHEHPSNNSGVRDNKIYNRFSMMSINDLKSERFSAPNSIIKDRFFNYNSNWNRNARKSTGGNDFDKVSTTDESVNNTKFTHHPHHHQNYHQQQAVAQVAPSTTASTAATAMQTLQQIQEAKPGNKRAILVDLPEYLYSIPALASFFEPYGEVAMLQILPRQKMWDGDLIDLLGASMCNRLSQHSYCAVVEFYSARMAKFIIGILRKRLPILKFRCALLKPSAAIELTNQADNLGLENAVRLRHSKKTSDSLSSANNDNSLDCASTTSSSSGGDVVKDNKVTPMMTIPAVVLTSSEGESGLEEMASSGNNQTSSSSCHDSESDHEGRFRRGNVVTNQNNTSSGPTSRTTSGDDNSQRFVTSFNIQLNR